MSVIIRYLFQIIGFIGEKGFKSMYFMLRSSCDVFFTLSYFLPPSILLSATEASAFLMHFMEGSEKLCLELAKHNILYYSDSGYNSRPKKSVLSSFVRRELLSSVSS